MEFIFLRIANKAITIIREVEGYKVVEQLGLLWEQWVPWLKTFWSWNEVAILIRSGKGAKQ